MLLAARPGPVTRCAVRSSGSNTDLVFHGVARDRIWLTRQAEEGEHQPGKRVFDGFKQTFVYQLTVTSNFSFTQAFFARRNTNIHLLNPLIFKGVYHFIIYVVDL